MAARDAQTKRSARQVQATSAARWHPAAAGPPAAATLGRQVHDAVRHWLIAGELVPGEKLSLRTIAARLAVSVQPVREAVARLVAEQALEVLPNRAVRVPVLDAATFDELTLLRLGIEGFAVERAAARRSGDDLAAMRRCEAEFRRHGERPRPDLKAAIAANQALHFVVYRAAGLPPLLPIVEGLWLRIGPLINLDLRSGDSRERIAKSVRCHAAMVDGVERAEAQAARAGLVADIEGAARHIRARLQAAGAVATVASTATDRVAGLARAAAVARVD